MKWWHEVSEAVTGYLGITGANFNRLAVTVAAFIVFFILKRVFTGILIKNTDDVEKSYYIRKSVTYTMATLMLLLILVVWLGAGRGAVTYFGILSAGLAIALRDPISNFVGWLYLVIRRPFTIGDRIEINRVSGDVVDIQLFRFSMIEVGNWVHADQSTGRIMHVPNGFVFNYTVANYTQEFKFIWNEISVLVPFEANWKKAKQVLLKITKENCDFEVSRARKQVNKAAKKYMIYYKHLTPIVWTSVNDSGVVLTIRYICDPRKRRQTESFIWEKILEEFDKLPDVVITYGTRRVVNFREEGKIRTGDNKTKKRGRDSGDEGYK